MWLCISLQTWFAAGKSAHFLWEEVNPGVEGSWECSHHFSLQGHDSTVRASKVFAQ